MPLEPSAAEFFFVLAIVRRGFVIYSSMRILLLSAYHSASHRYWCQGLMGGFPEIEWTLLTQPARHFSWRVRASGLIWGRHDDPAWAQNYDLIIATSLSDIVTIKGLRPKLQQTPVWLYFHENQFAHPRSGNQTSNQQISWQFQSILNALSADWISFNTAFNRDSFLRGAKKLLRIFPEKLPGNPIEQLALRSDVLPVPLTDRFANFADAPKVPNRIVWNHRWEWDKRPEHFLRVLIKLQARGVDFELAMLGIGDAHQAGAFEEEAERLNERIVHWGEANETDYMHWIRSAGVGVSTAIHDFQGLAMLELAQAGATVVVPNRLAYPECLPTACFYRGSDNDPEQDAADLEKALFQILSGHRPAPVKAEALPRWKNLAENYRKQISRLATR